MLILEKAKAIPPAEEIFEDEEFRGWVVNSAGLVMPLQDMDSRQLRFKEDVSIRPIERVFFETLNDFNGQILPNKLLLQRVADFWGEQPNDTRNKEYVNTYMSRLKNKVENPEILKNFYNLGYGAGVLRHAFRPAIIARFIYALWQRFDEEVPNSVLAQVLYGDDSDAKLEASRRNVSRFYQSCPSESNVRIARFPKVSPGTIRLTWI